ncbi:MAG TPA: SDR family oxidoreductase [Xanthobacteraceae bacterium]|jgi:NAD(P)-dependent dehydrogenase (short-subunit alcohol dehydrogenase family)
MTSLADRIIVVTGGARGLGRAFAESCAAAGATVVIADREAQLGQASCRAIAERGHAASFLHVDLADPSAIELFAAALADRFGRLDGLVNNAALATGIGGKSFEEIDIDTWDRVMTINVRGTWLVTRACAPLLRRGQRSKIVNIASDTALWGAPRLLHYVASKGAVIAMTRALARELGPDGIAVNAVAPGLVRVEATEYVPRERHALYETGRAISRAQYPEDCVGAVLFLLSPAADFITGQLLPVNGGFVFN